MMTFDQMWKLGEWRPIRDCPGRFVLGNRPTGFKLQQLLGFEPDVWEFRSSAARDTVRVVCLADGGIISYQRKDGTFLHTLNTRQGFNRKLAQLGISLPPPLASPPDGS